MSVVKSTSIRDLAGHDAYVGEGRGDQRREHLADGSDRFAPGSRSDLPRGEFVALGRQLAREHGRRVEALGIVVAWDPAELSIGNPRRPPACGRSCVRARQKAAPSLTGIGRGARGRSR